MSSIIWRHACRQIILAILIDNFGVEHIEKCTAFTFEMLYKNIKTSQLLQKPLCMDQTQLRLPREHFLTKQENHYYGLAFAKYGKLCKCV